MHLMAFQFKHADWHKIYGLKHHAYCMEDYEEYEEENFISMAKVSKHSKNTQVVTYHDHWSVMSIKQERWSVKPIKQLGGQFN